MSHPEGHWGLPGSGAAGQLGSWVVPLRTTGLCRALGLEEMGKMPQYLLTLVLVTFFFPVCKNAFLIQLSHGPSMLAHLPGCCLPGKPSMGLSPAGLSPSQVPLGCTSNLPYIFLRL